MKERIECFNLILSLKERLKEDRIRLLVPWNEKNLVPWNEKKGKEESKMREEF